MAQPFEIDRQRRAAALLDRFWADPPQTLLFEGGTPDERLGLARRWAALLNCSSGDSAPCGVCPSCVRILEGADRDFIVFDGREGSIKIDAVRELRPILGQPPTGDGYRCVVLAEAQNLTLEAANALLKSLEEPRPGNAFVLLAPQRERLLETLVSRSWVVTLAWPEPGCGDPEAVEWAEAMVDFWRSGRGWFERTNPKGAVTRDLALAVIAELGGNLARAMAGTTTGKADTAMAAMFDPTGFRRLDQMLAKAHEALTIGPATFASPALVLDWAATRLARS